MIKALIVEDEPLARDELSYLLKRSNKIEIVGECDCLEMALNIIDELEIDVIFLDIELGEENGMSIAEKLKTKENAPEIVFATAYDEYALRAFEVNAIDYLLKPFEEERINQTIIKLVKMRDRKWNEGQVIKTSHAPLHNNKLAVTTNEKIKIIDIDKIIYISAQNGKTLLVTDEEELIVTFTLSQLEQKLLNSSIMKVHRSYLVNKEKIREIEPWFNSTYLLCMNSGEKVPLSRNFTKEIKQLFGF
ncbi:LytTR family transcriptional regulator DNA-binding domain-containing protein [Niallia sp.]|uniref:LytR/AlgR family response regulator transcription factor n=1 Tax=Niallia sp. TaxID=2837523 RepID=UPI002898082A|nr:LytTR family transcriptional regulator DNA-binding domain-containing protein [Niallia sp.]